MFRVIACVASFLVLTAASTLAVAADLVWPEKNWDHRTPQEAGLAKDKLDALAEFVGGRGCVVRQGRMVYAWGDQARCGDVASAMKPVISTLLLLAVQEGRIKGVDDPIVAFEPLLRTINGGKDAAITWRHLASQTSGYGLVEKPGEAYSYNDYALALYYDTLMGRVFRQDGTQVLQERLGDELGFEDKYTFDVFGRSDRAGRLGISVRDFARFGLFYLRGGQWRGRQLLRPELVQMAISSPIPADTPLTSRKYADMLPDQRTIGGTRTITMEGPGQYSFNWWTNGKDKAGRRRLDSLPPDAYMASGHGGARELWIIPSLDLIVSWNDSTALRENLAKLRDAATRVMDAVIEPNP